MSTQTPNLGLVKQAGGERPLVSVINANMDKLDAVIGPNDTAEDGSLKAQIDALRDSVSSNYTDVTATSSSSGNLTTTIPISSRILGVVAKAYSGGTPIAIPWTDVSRQTWLLMVRDSGTFAARGSESFTFRVYHD